MSWKALSEEFERNLIRETLEKTENNKAQAAKLLDMNRTTLVEKMRRLGFKLNVPSRKLKKFRALQQETSWDDDPE